MLFSPLIIHSPVIDTVRRIIISTVFTARITNGRTDNNNKATVMYFSDVNIDLFLVDLRCQLLVK